jgi:hypothetical protein
MNTESPRLTALTPNNLTRLVAVGYMGQCVVFNRTRGRGGTHRPEVVNVVAEPECQLGCEWSLRVVPDPPC